MLKALATVEQYKRYNRISENQNGVASKGFNVVNKESDEEITLYLNAASATIREYTNRLFTNAKVTELFMNEIGNVLITSEDIKSISEITNNSYNIDNDNITFYGNTITSNFILSGTSLVVYDNDFTEVPADITQSCIQLASLMSRKKDRIGEYSVTNGDNTTTYLNVDLPPDVRFILDNYVNYFSTSRVIKVEEIV